MIWNRKLWGIEFTAKNGIGVLISRLWLDKTPSTYEGEPTRALLFTTRKLARKYCAAGTKALGRFRPVRVVETVRKIK